MLDFIAAGALFKNGCKTFIESTPAFRAIFGNTVSFEELLVKFHIDDSISELPYAEWIKIHDMNYFLTIRHLEEKIAVILYKDPLIEELYTTLKNESLYDALTDALRKNFGEQRIYETLKLFERDKNNSFSILIYDIDHFKKINDTYGHLAGDYILKELSARIKSILRDSDIFIRFGGEEFLLLLPTTKISGATILAQRILQKSSHDPYVFQEQQIYLTVSIGITSPLKSDSLASLLERADQALYKAKSSGRNQMQYF
jgi:diguanylate cyclase (GGDEF)-like protein